VASRPCVYEKSEKQSL